MRFLLDTNVLIDVLHRDAPMIQALWEATRRGDDLAISAVVVAEVYAGIRVGEERRTWNLVESFPCISVTQSIAKRAGEMKMLWARKGVTLSLADAMIAATALEHHLPLMTKNRKHFPAQGLVFYPTP